MGEWLRSTLLILVLALSATYAFATTANGVPGVRICEVDHDCAAGAARIDSICPSDYGAACNTNAGACDRDCRGDQGDNPVSGLCCNGLTVVNGVCTAQVCGNGVTEGTEACDGGACCNVDCTLKAAGTTCNAAQGTCDVAETCNGISGACPADAKRPNGYVCRATTNAACDQAETCDGASNSCPLDANSCPQCNYDNICQITETQSCQGADCTCGDGVQSSWEACDSGAGNVAACPNRGVQAYCLQGSCTVDQCYALPTATNWVTQNPPNAKTFTMTASGTKDNRLAWSECAIDANQNNVYEAGEKSASVPCSATLTKPTGTYTYNAYVKDSQGQQATTVITVTTVSQPPQISGWPPTTTQRWQRADVSYNFQYSDDEAGASYSLDTGDGTIIADSCPGVSCSYTSTRTYPLGTYTATLTVSDTDAQTTAAAPYTISATGLACKAGSPAGAPLLPPYDNDPAQCCTDACSDTYEGQQYCFAVANCYPDSTRICAGNPAAWYDRDYNQTLCEAASSTCTQYGWTANTFRTLPQDTQVPQCVYDDSNDYVPAEVAPTVDLNLGPPVCDNPGMCYTGVGKAGCYLKIPSENNAALCNDAIDNDCDGYYDFQEDECYSPSLRVTVTLLDLDGNPVHAVDDKVKTKVVLSNTNEPQYAPDPQSAQATIIFSKNRYLYTGAGADFGLFAGEPQRWISVSRPGYQTNTQKITLSPNTDTDVSVSLIARRCNKDCTNDQGYCDASCIGVNGCNSQPTAEQRAVLEACSAQQTGFGYKPGTEIQLGLTQDNQQLVGICCTVEASPRSTPAVSVQENANVNKITTLVKYTRVVTLNGRVYTLVINTWQ